MGGMDRLSETRMRERGDFSKMLSDKQTYLGSDNIKTFYMIDKNDHNRQTKLGLLKTTANENLLEKHKFLLDSQNLNYLSVGVEKKRLAEI